ncbi:MAG: hypothetical protein WKH97_00710 [Casimicrobiaceae bacterium]
MKKSLLAVAIAVAFATATPLALAQVTSTAGGGSGGAGGSSAGGAATGGTATNSNTTSGVSNASGGIGQGGLGGASNSQSSGGSASSQAAGGNVGTVSTGGSSAQLGDVTINYNAGSSPMGKDGFGVGVDPNTGHVVTDNTIRYNGSYKVKNTPDVGVGGPASGPCNGFSAGLGVSVAGFGIGGNTSTVDEGCTARETARVAAMIGRMDIANAVLENLPAVQAAMRAKAAREAPFTAPRSEAPGPVPATTSPARPSLIPDGKEAAQVQAIREAAAKAQESARQAKEAALREQQAQAQEALTRQATMAKATDTIKFTDAVSQGNEKTPQEVMAEEASKKLTANLQQAVMKKQEVPQEQVTSIPSPVQQQSAAPAPSPVQQAATTPVPLQQPASAAELRPQQPQAVATPLPPQQQAITAPLRPQQSVQPQVEANALQAMNLKFEGPKSAEAQGGGRAVQQFPQSAPEDRMKAAKVALNLK